MLPAAGFRLYDDGALLNRGSGGYYWSSTEFGTIGAWYLVFNIDEARTNDVGLSYGFSVRCIAE
jgi:hypothetical protein